MSFEQFLHMDGHGFYVWLSYAVAALVFLGLLFEPVLRRQSLRKRIAAFYRREQLDREQPDHQPHGDR